MRRTKEQLLNDIAIPQSLEKWKSKINKELAQLTKKYPDNERLTWPNSYEEAKAYLADTASVVPLLDAAATEAGMNKTELANVIVTNANNFRAASGQLVGKRIKGDAQIKACTTLEELKDIEVQLGI